MNIIEENKKNKIRKEKDDTQWENDSDFDYDADTPVNISDKQEDGCDGFLKDATGVAFFNDTKAYSTLQIQFLTHRQVYLVKQIKMISILNCLAA